MASQLNFHPKKILCPVDMSELSDLALKYAHVGASVFDANLTVLHAMHFEYPRYLSSDLTTRVLAELDNAKQTVAKEIEAHIRSVLGAVEDVGYHVIDTPPAEAVMQALSDKAIDLVVMGTHGYSGFKHWMLGSVTESVIHQSKVPVFMVRQKIDDFIDTSQPEARPRINRILCPCNRTEAAARALQVAASLAQRFKAGLTIVRIEESGSKDTDGLSDWIQNTVKDTLDIDVITQSGPAAQQIVSLAKTQNCDMVVIGAHDKPFEQGRVMGRTTELVLRHAPVPVLAVPFQDQ